MLYYIALYYKITSCVMLYIPLWVTCHITITIYVIMYLLILYNRVLSIWYSDGELTHLSRASHTGRINTSHISHRSRGSSHLRHLSRVGHSNSYHSTVSYIMLYCIPLYPTVGCIILDAIILYCVIAHSLWFYHIKYDDVTLYS